MALVEFALVAPLIFSLMLGMFTGGISMSRKNSMTNATREGARLGATLTHDSSWADAVRTRVKDLSSGDLTTSQICVKLVQAPSTVVEASSCSGVAGEPSMTGIPASECAVLVWATRTSDLEAIFFSRTLTLTTSSVSRYERTCP